MTLQEGIAWEAGRRVGAFFGLVCLRRAPGAPTGAAAAALTDLWARWRALQHGELPDLRAPRVPAGDLEMLVGYGGRAFADRADIGTELWEYGFAAPNGDRGVMPGAALRYAPDLGDNPADADVAVQVTARSQTAVTRAVVEAARRLSDPEAPGHGALTVSGAFLGYRRDDQRSWIGFHDGVNNMDPSERLNAIQVGPAADESWLRGGTYLAYLRIAVDLAAWDRLPVAQQELLVGRDKRTGAPLVAAGGQVRPAPLAPGTVDVLAPENQGLREPLPVALDDATGLGMSHVQRARRHPSLRMFRQGYEFLETLDRPPLLRTGLNFCSFQASPLVLATVLRTGSWLGAVAFSGGPGAPAPGDLVSVRAAGLYAVPPAAGEDVPGLAAVWPD